MLQVFRNRNHYIKGVVIPGRVDYIRQTYTQKLRILREYYRERTFYLRNDNLLVRLLTMGLGSLHTDYQTYTLTASYRANFLVRHFRLTSSVCYGDMHDGVFYGKGSYEVIVGDNSDFDIEDTVKNWKDVEAVKVMTHAISDFNLTLPNGRNNHFVDGIAVIYVNIPQLLLQYRMFIEDQSRNNPEQPIITPKLFIYRYVLPNMMNSHLDHVFLNRFMNLESGAPMTEGLIKSAFYQAEAGNNEDSGIIAAVNTAQSDVLEKVQRTRADYDNILANIFTINTENALKLLELPDLALTQQVWWALLLARLKHVKFLLSTTNLYYKGHNRSDSNHLWIDYSRLLDSNVLESVMRSEILESTIYDINEVLKMAKA